MAFEEADKEYPYDPVNEGHADRFHGLDKLRAFREEGMRRSVYYAMTEKRDREPGKVPQPPLPAYRRPQPGPPPGSDQGEDETKERPPWWNR